MNNKKSVIATKDGPIELSPEYVPLIELLIAAGYISDVSITDEKIRQSHQNYLQKAYHNTEKLLDNYRKFAWMIKYFPENVANELDLQYSSTDELFHLLDLECAKGNKKVESRLMSYFPSRDRFARLNEAINALQYYPDTGPILYRIIMMRYIDEKTYTLDEILKEIQLGKTQYSKYRKEAIRYISVLLWGADNKEESFVLQTIDFLKKERKANNAQS